MGQITLVISDAAEKLLRLKNSKKGDMGNYVSNLIIKDSDASFTSTGKSCGEGL